jgi:CubicO group peptidase (beta-lactamase class C family)
VRSRRKQPRGFAAEHRDELPTPHFVPTRFRATEINLKIPRVGAHGDGSTSAMVELGTPGYTFGLMFAVRPQQGIAGVPGSPGEFMWAGYAGTYFWIDPKEELAVVYMTQAPSPIRAYYRRLMKQLVYGAIVD